MSTGLSQYVPLKQVVAYFADQYNLSEGDEDRYWILGMRGLTELNYDISALPKTVRLPVLPNFTVPFPSDLLSWSKIGIQDGNGQISTLKINNALTTFRDDNPNRLRAIEDTEINDQVNNLLGAPYFLNFYNDGYYNNYYFGVTGGLVQYGECRVDAKNRVIILPPDFRYSSILVEYISSPQLDPDFTVDLALQEAVIAFIAWKMKLGSDRDFYNEARKSRRRLPGKKITLQEISQFVREQTGGYLHA